MPAPNMYTLRYPRYGAGPFIRQKEEAPDIAGAMATGTQLGLQQRRQRHAEEQDKLARTIAEEELKLRKKGEKRQSRAQTERERANRAAEKLGKKELRERKAAGERAHEEAVERIQTQFAYYMSRYAREKMAYAKQLKEAGVPVDKLPDVVNEAFPPPFPQAQSQAAPQPPAPEQAAPSALGGSLNEVAEARRVVEGLVDDRSAPQAIKDEIAAILKACRESGQPVPWVEILRSDDLRAYLGGG